MAISATDYQAMSDVKLVIAISRYDQAALAQVYERHGPAVFGLALRMLRDRTLAEDVVQTVFMKFWDQPDRFDPDRGALRSFLLANAHGRTVDLLRAESSRRQREEKAEARNPEPDYDLEREVVDLTNAERVREALDGLMENERRAIELAYFSGRTYQEVALVLDEPEGTVKSRIRSGLKKMRVALVDAGMEAP
jgi:RNA polymerase sigma-70 factor (ECF subfamily)